VRTRTYTRYAELFVWPLSLALAALVCEVALGARRAPLP